MVRPTTLRFDQVILSDGRRMVTAVATRRERGEVASGKNCFRLKDSDRRLFAGRFFRLSMD